MLKTEEYELKVTLPEEEDIKKFINDVESVCGKQKFTVEYKFDGLTVCLTYDDGKFVRATTRGNGVTGEDVTAQVLTIKSLPLKIDYKGHLYVRGEGMMRLSDLKKYNEKIQVSWRYDRYVA